MLNQVPTAMRTAVAGVTLRHPNAIECVVYRRATVRTAAAEAGTLGGLPSLGGLGVMDAEDEAQVDYTRLGDGKVLFAGRYEPSDLGDRRDHAEASADSEALVEPIVPGGFDCRDGDLVMVMPGAGVVITYEVTRVLNTVNIPPFVPKYVLSPHADMMFIPEVADSQADRP